MFSLLVLLNKQELAYLYIERTGPFCKVQIHEWDLLDDAERDAHVEYLRRIQTDHGIDLTDLFPRLSLNVAGAI